MAGMPWWRFLAHNSAGAALWVNFWGVGFYVFGQHLSCLMPRLGHVLPIVGAAALLLVLIGIFLCRRWAKSTTAEGLQPPMAPGAPRTSASVYAAGRLVC